MRTTEYGKRRLKMAKPTNCGENRCEVKNLNSWLVRLGDLPVGARFIYPFYNHTNQKDGTIRYMDIYTVRSGHNPVCQKGGYSQTFGPDYLVIPIVFEHDRPQKKY
jgi:hypothetical protein